MFKGGHVYIMTNKKDGVLYVGVTSSLLNRVIQHRTHALKGFTNKYNCTKLVWYEEYEEIVTAIAREKEIKKWKREWKIAAIEKENPEWEDLFLEDVPDGGIKGLHNYEIPDRLDAIAVRDDEEE